MSIVGSSLLLGSSSSSGFGQLWGWGRGGAQFGSGSSTNISSPVQIGTASTWGVPRGAPAGSDEQSAAILRQDGTAWAWGNNVQGQLATGNTTNQLTPVQIGALSSWSFVLSNYQNFMGVRNDGTLWTAGNNYVGQLGLGDTTSRSSPTQVGLLTNWKSGGIGGSRGPMLAVKTDGTLWAWGSGQTGATGLGNTTNYSSPRQVGSLTNWASASVGGQYGSSAATAAIKTDGTLWTWGNASHVSSGKLGLGNLTNYSSPKQVGALTNWASVSVGQYAMAAVKTDGTLWTWGYGGQGLLGLGNTTSYSSPKQVGALTNWASVSVGKQHMLAVKTDGTLWAWGRNTYGQLGLGDTVNRSSPVQIGSATTWVGCQALSQASVATRT